MEGHPFGRDAIKFLDNPLRLESEQNYLSKNKN